ncbi:MAG TPA: GNAT family N-acetyltransferase [Solirubrobacteraceae bacterium]|nr:GNAT family N-acetyltransferase [Solirubrobacteraceae bacterium]
MITVETIADTGGLAALEPEWDALVRAMPRPSPFLLHGWLTEWCRHHAGEAALRVHVVRHEGRLAGALPLIVRRRYGLRVLSFIGGDASALADVLVSPTAPPGTVSALAEHAAAANGHDLADLFGLGGQSRLAATLGSERLSLLPRAEAPVLELPDGWPAAYTARMSSRHRSLDRRRRRQLGELGPLTVEVARDVEALGPALEAAFALHAARWRDRPEASGFATPAGRAFHRAAIRALAPLGVPRIVLLCVGGRPVACNYFLLLRETMFFHELAFHPDFARFSPGWLATLEALSAAAADGARRVEFLGGTERYKLELTDRREPLYQGLGLASTRRGRAGVRARTAAVAMRRRLKDTPVRRVYYEHLAPARRAVRRLRS